MNTFCSGSHLTKGRGKSSPCLVVESDLWDGHGSSSSVGLKLFRVVSRAGSCFLQTLFTEDLFLILSLSSFCPVLSRVFRSKWRAVKVHVHMALASPLGSTAQPVNTLTISSSVITHFPRFNSVVAFNDELDLPKILQLTHFSQQVVLLQQAGRSVRFVCRW